MSEHGPKRTSIEIERDRREIADLYLKGWLQSAIAEHINETERGYTLTQQMISYDLKRLQEQWRESALIDINEAKAHELAKIDRLEREYWDAWERSKENAETTISESVDDAKGGHTKAQLRKVGQTGDPRFLKGVEWCIERRCKILGVDAANKISIMQDGPPKVDFSQYQDDPAAFSIKELWSKPTPGQLAVMESVRDHVITVVKSANAVGKTFIGADISLWFLRCFRHSKVFMTAAPPLENLERLLWGEIERKMIDRPAAFVDATSKHLDIAFAPDWYINGLTIPASGTSAQREAKFSGKHAPHMLFIIDEGDAVPIEVYRGIESCMSGGHARLVVFFNPRAQTGPVYDLIKAGAHVVELSAFEHPNVKTGYTVIPGAVSRKKTVERICKWSRSELPEDERKTDDPEWFQVPAFLDGETVKREDGTEYPPLVGGQWRKVTNPALSYMTLARYPGQAENQLISRAWVEAAQQRWLVWQSEHGENPPGDIRPIHGQDVAEFGKDKNVACFRYGGWVAPFESWGGMDVLVGAEKAAELARDKNARDSYTDATGVGSGTAPMMIRHWRKIGYTDCDARAIKVAKSPTVKVEEGEFKILRDQLWWLCREWLRTDPAAMLPPDLDPSNTLADELCAVMYRVKGGKIQVTPKEDLRKTLGRSPDKADALCLTFGDSVPKYAPSAYG